MNRTLRTPFLGLTALLVVVPLAGVLGAACGDSQSPTTLGTLASITVTPNVTLAIKATQQFIAVGKDAAGARVAISPTWSMEGRGGTISDAGLFTADTSPGTFTGTVKASSGGISGTASVTVTDGVVATRAPACSLEHCLVLRN